MKDREILEQVLELYSEEKEATTSALMVKVGSYFLETPYVAHTLEEYLLNSKSASGIMLARPL